MKIIKRLKNILFKFFTGYEYEHLDFKKMSEQKHLKE